MSKDNPTYNEWQIDRRARLRIERARMWRKFRRAVFVISYAGALFALFVAGCARW